ncbi:MAG: hypothetical protein RBS19_10595 [Bacteroidales bacterium]|nr:hypothetical protein [Bacteroidales bacterium]
MPIESIYLDPILSVYKNMVEDCKQKEISGEDFDAMVACYQRMEELGQSTDDMNVFYGSMMQENIYAKFSDHYSKAIIAQSQQASSAGGDSGYDDGAMLKQNINALKAAIKQLEDSFKEALRMASTEVAEASRKKQFDYAFEKNDQEFKDQGYDPEKSRKFEDDTHRDAMKKTPNMLDSTVEVEVMHNPEALIKPILKLIELGEQPGMTFPTFLRLQIEQGLDKAMEGTGVVRDGLVYFVDFFDAFPSNPFQKEVAKKKLESFDKLVAGSKFKTADISELNLLFDDIEREFEPKIRKWEIIVDLWEQMLDDLFIWSLAYHRFAPYIDPWKYTLDPKESVITDQNTLPGIFKEREKLLLKYFGMSFMDIFKHETFEFEVKKSRLYYSQEIIEHLIEDIYSQCRPFNHLPEELIEKRGNFNPEINIPNSREVNPELHIPLQNFIKFYNSKYGEGRYESKYPPVEIIPNVLSKPWNWETFKYKS